MPDRTQNRRMGRNRPEFKPANQYPTNLENRILSLPHRDLCEQRSQIGTRNESVFDKSVNRTLLYPYLQTTDTDSG